MINEMLIDEVGWLVCEKAEEIFRHCGAAEDFCVQHVGSEAVVFGGTNRIIWSPTGGFRLDSDYCTERFKQAFGQASL